MAKQRDALHPALWMSLILKGCPTPGAARSTRTDSHLLQAASAWDGQAAQAAEGEAGVRHGRRRGVQRHQEEGGGHVSGEYDLVNAWASPGKGS